MEQPVKTLGALILAAGSRRAAARALDVAPSAVSAWVSGTKRPDPGNLLGLAKYLQRSVSELMELVGYSSAQAGAHPGPSGPVDDDAIEDWLGSWRTQIAFARNENRAGNPVAALALLESVRSGTKATLLSVKRSAIHRQKDLLPDLLAIRFDCLGEFVQVHNDVTSRERLRDEVAPWLGVMERILQQLDDLDVDTYDRNLRLLALSADLWHLVPGQLATSDDFVQTGLKFLGRRAGRLDGEFVKAAEILRRVDLLNHGLKAAQGATKREYDHALRDADQFIADYADDGIPAPDVADLYEGLARAAGGRRLAGDAKRFLREGLRISDGIAQAEDEGPYLRVNLSLRQTELLLGSQHVLDIPATVRRMKMVTAITLASTCGASRSEREMQDRLESLA